MSTSCKKFFDIPELLNLLTTYLTLKDVLNLVLTSRRMHRLVTPTLYQDLEVPHGREFRMFTSFPALHALARNVQHVRMLMIGVDELAYLYNCELAFQELTSWTTDTPLPRLSWLPPADIRSCQVVALPPISRLSELKLHMVISSNYPYTMRSINSPRANLSQLCWLLFLNPGLATLTLYGVPILDFRGSRLFGGAIASLSKLKTLTVWLHCRSKEWSQLLTYAFICCRPSIQKLTLIMESYKNSERSHEAIAEDKHEEWWKRNEDLAPLIKTQELLINLKELTLQGPRKFVWKSLGVLPSLFSHSPNIKKLELDINIDAGEKETDILGQFIAQECPKIESLSCGSVNAHVHDPLGFRILDSLPPQQVTSFNYSGVLSAINSPTINVSVLQHSTSLREVRLNGAEGHYYISASAILRECRNLEKLYILFLPEGGLFIPLDDALKHPWGCTKLTHLTLAISGCELPDELGVMSYYRRPTPITLTEDETLHFARLGELYRRIGALKELRKLDLHMPLFDEAGEVDTRCFDDPTSFPAMLNLEDARRGRPGFLQQLSGLKKLETLRGSVCAWSDETKINLNLNPHSIANMSTSTACEQFFDIPELPRLLTVFLDRKDVSRLARTCRKMDNLCTPSLYSSLEQSIDGYCMLAFEELYSQILDTSLSRFPWLPPLDIRTCQVVALPSMARLSSLHLSLDPSDKEPCTMPSASDVRAVLPQLCWYTHNPCLTDLALISVLLLDLRDGRVFVKALAGLTKLKILSLRIHCREDDWIEL
ncbi:hypothetical protein BG015_008374 [Linnemannia schmuckeri]|uniref:F-box domain-containing protein n=1 Tax=Linnemannia schmuckeri TaxID=64567 RepID=A0A9P5S0K3_9FUNG|nr:hypothetical protein BG015_008374 [Linnemannia schmuckeri]